MENIFDKRLQQIMSVTLVLLAVFLLVKTVGAIVDVSSKKEMTSKVSHRITFNGSAQVAVTPDVAGFVVTVREIDKDALSAQQKMTAKANKAIELFKKMGIAKSDIQTKNYNTSPKYSFNPVYCLNDNCGPQQRTISGYEARETISITLRDLGKVGGVLTQIAELKIYEVRGPQFSVSDETKFKKQAQAAAIKDAKAKAEITAKNLGIALGKIVSFSEAPQFRQHYSAMAMERDESVSFLSSPQVEAGEQMVKSSVSISYEIQ